MIDFIQGQQPFVAFVGAGASAIPPSNLPTWNAFNDLLLECLCERLMEFSSNALEASIKNLKRKAIEHHNKNNR